jgi:hypothetical protein
MAGNVGTKRQIIFSIADLTVTRLAAITLQLPMF